MCRGDAGVRMADVETVPAVCFGTRSEIQPGQGVHRPLMDSETVLLTLQDENRTAQRLAMRCF